MNVPTAPQKGPVRAVPRDLAGRVPPHNQDAEAAVLSAVLTERRAMDAVVGILTTGEEFYTDAHRRIWAVALEQHQQGQPVDIQTVAEILRSRDRLQAIGGLAYLARLVDATPAVANVAAHARIVRDLSRVRTLIEACQLGAAEAFGDFGGNVQDFLNRTAQRLNEIAVTQGDRQEPALLYDTIKSVVDSYESPAPPGVPTGLRALDAFIGGLMPGELVVVAGRPGMGKTAFSLNLATNITDSTRRVPPGHGEEAAPEYGAILFSLEMPRNQFAARIACSEARVAVSALRRRTLTGNDWDRFIIACSELSQRPIWIDDTAAISVAEIEAKVRAKQREFDVFVEDAQGRRVYRRRLFYVLIDYLQLMKAVGDHRSREQEISSITRELKAMSKRLDVPVVAVSQLNRSVETRGKDKRPQLSDLRESGAIEQDSDVILFPFRPEYYIVDKESPEARALAGKAEIIVAKQRNGPTGDARVRYHDRYTRFEDDEEGGRGP